MPALAARARPDPHRNLTVNESAAAAIQTECLIVGAGPVGLFAVFELGLLGMKCEIVDSLAHPGGQCTELYPDKPIYDIPALPVCGAQELIDRLLEQIKPFHAGFHLGQEVVGGRDGRRPGALPWRPRPARASTPAASSSRPASVRSSRGGCWCPTRSVSRARSSTIACSAPRNSTARTCWSRAGATARSTGSLEFCGKARSVTLVHRRAEFRAQPASVARMKALAAEGRIRYHEGSIQSLASSNGRLSGVTILGARQGDRGRRL